MKHYTVTVKEIIPGMYEYPIQSPIVYEAESILQLVVGLTPICEDSDLEITSIRLATEEEIEVSRREWQEDEYVEDNFEDDFADFMDEFVSTLSNE